MTKQIEEEQAAIGTEQPSEQSAEVVGQPAMESAETTTDRKTEEAPATGMRPSDTYHFIEPVKFEGKTYDRIDYDLTKLKATEVMQCRRQASMMRGPVPDPAGMLEDDLLHAILFALSANLPDVFIQEMGAADYMVWATAAQGFFFQAFQNPVR